MRFRLSSHAQAELMNRSIPVTLVETVLEQPEQVVPARAGRKAYQSRIDFGGKTFLLRAIVRDDLDPALVITVYRTSKIAK